MLAAGHESKDAVYSNHDESTNSQIRNLVVGDQFCAADVDLSCSKVHCHSCLLAGAWLFLKNVFLLYRWKWWLLWKMWRLLMPVRIVNSVTVSMWLEAGWLRGLGKLWPQFMHNGSIWFYQCGNARLCYSNDSLIVPDIFAPWMNISSLKCSFCLWDMLIANLNSQQKYIFFHPNI